MKIPANRWNSFLPPLIVIFLVIGCFVATSWGASDGGHGAEAAPKGWVATDTYRVMNFVVLAVGLFILLRKPISQLLKGRIKSIEDQLNDLEAQKKEAERILAEYDEKLVHLEKEADKIMAEYVRQGEDAKSRIIQAATAAAEKIEEQAHRNIEHEFKMAKLKLQEEILEKALEKAEEKIKSKITPDDQKKLVDEYIDKVVI